MTQITTQDRSKTAQKRSTKVKRKTGRVTPTPAVFPTAAAARLKNLRDFDELPNDARVRVGVVADLFDLSLPSIFRMARDGRLPAPERLGRATLFRVGDLRAHRFAG